MAKTTLVTGATGTLGSEVVSSCCQLKEKEKKEV
jgi:FlaA1/EpsC-like NDP-sugar epimerase